MAKGVCAQQRMWISLLSSALLLLGSPAVQAQVPNLGSELRKLMPWASGCAKVRSWMDAVMARRGPVQRSDATLMLAVSDELFVPAFGKSYEQLAPDDFRRFNMETRPACVRERTLSPEEMQLVGQVWDQRMQAQLARRIAQSRSERNEVVSLFSELDRLQANEADYERLRAVGQRGKALARQMSPDEQRQFNERYETAFARVAIPVEEERVTRLIREAQGPGGMSALLEQQGRLNSAGLPAAIADALRQQLQGRISELSPGLLAAERERWRQLPGGEGGLSAGADWLRQYDRQYQALYKQAPAFEQLRSEVLQQRAVEAARLQRPLLQRLQRSQDQLELQGIAAALFIPEELAREPGLLVKRVAEERLAQLRALVYDERVFGRQPEHAAILAGTLNQQALGRADTGGKPAIALCDRLAAEPRDPNRRDVGVEQVDGQAALQACDEAVKLEPNSGRLQMQRGRALLALARAAEAVAAFQKAAKLNDGAAHYYLATAYELGVGGLPRDPNAARQHRTRAEAQGYGSSAPVPAGASGREVLTDATELADKYEFGLIMKAVYWGSSAMFPSTSKLFRYKYLLGQAGMLSGACRSFKLSDVRAFEATLQRREMPASVGEVYNMDNVMRMFQAGLNAINNPRSVVDQNQKFQRYEDAPLYAQRDLELFLQTYGGCASPVLARYTGNLRSYLKNVEE